MRRRALIAVGVVAVIVAVVVVVVLTRGGTMTGAQVAYCINSHPSGDLVLSEDRRDLDFIAQAAGDRGMVLQDDQQEIAIRRRTVRAGREGDRGRV